MKLTIEMPVVTRCTVSECAYNVSVGCHARAVTVGDGANPGCDTFLPGTRHTHDTTNMAGVGACKVESCKYNKEFECSAEGINVGGHNSRVLCLTFSPRA